LGISIAIAGGITMASALVILGVASTALNELGLENEASSVAFKNNDAISKTDIRIFGINATVGSNLVNFTVGNEGIEKVWNYDEFDLYITYDANILGVSTRVTEEFNFNETALAVSTGQATLTPDFRIQRGVTVFGAGAGAANDVTTANILDVDQSRAFVRLTNVMFASGGLDVNTGTGSNRNNDDLGVRAEITADDTITFTRLASGENADYRVVWEVWEYIGKEGGYNEFLVRDVIEVTTGGSTAVDTDIAGIVDRNKVVPFTTGVTNTGTGRTWDDANAAVWLVNGSVESDAVRVQRLGVSGTTITGLAIVEFTGSNWKVQNNIDIPLSGLATATNHVQQINPVKSWTDAFILSSKNNQNGQAGLVDSGWNVWPHPSNLDEFHYRLRDLSGPFTTEKIVAHIVENFFLRVEHIDSLTGTRAEHPTTQPADNEADEPITQLDDLTQSGIIATHDTAGSATGTAYPRMFWNYRFDVDDNVEWYRGRDGQPGDFAMQVIQFPQSEWCIGGTSTIISINEWTIDCITYDYIEPGIINPNEAPEILTKLQHPIYANAFLQIRLWV